MSSSGSSWDFLNNFLLDQRKSTKIGQYINNMMHFNIFKRNNIFLYLKIFNLVVKVKILKFSKMTLWSKCVQNPIRKLYFLHHFKNSPDHTFDHF